MNVFEISSIVCPIIGVIAGVRSAIGAPIWRVMAAATSGFVLGFTCHFVAMLLVGATLKLTRFDADKERLSNSQRFASLLAMLFPIVAPIAAWVSATYVARSLFA